MYLSEINQLFLFFNSHSANFKISLPRNIIMTKYLASLTLVLLTVTGAANATIIKTSGQAVTACKSHIKQNVQGVTSAKSIKIRSLRGNHVITLAVKSESGRQKTVCSVNRKDGSIVLNQ